MDWFLYANGLRHERVNSITSVYRLGYTRLEGKLVTRIMVQKKHFKDYVEKKAIITENHINKTYMHRKHRNSP